MRKRTSVQNFVPSHTAGKRSPKRAARLPFSTCCASHWPQIVPLLVDGGSSEKAAGSAYFRAQRLPAYIWQTASKRGSSIAIGDIAEKY